MINVGRSSPGPASTELLVFGSGDGTGVTATYEETLSEGSVYWTSDAITFDEESDAAKLFGEALDLTGNISYGDAPGWHMDLILEGLDPNREYVFAGTAMRGGGAGVCGAHDQLENHGGGEFCVCQFGGGVEGERGERGVQHGAQRGGLRGEVDGHCSGSRMGGS